MSTELQSNHAPLKRILICGLGSIGRKHLRILHCNFPEIELSVLRSGHGAECPEMSLITHQFSDMDVAISWKPDAAVISTPAPFHQQQALSLVRQKVPVLIEKPLGIGGESRQGWDELLKLSQTVPVVIGYVLRHDPCAEYIKDILDNRILGKVLEADFYCGSWLPDWRPGSDYRSSVSSQRLLGGGALLELSHEIDLAFWLLKDFEITSASLVQSGLLDLDVEDQVLLTGSGYTGFLITIRLNMCTKPSRRCVVIRCEKGEVAWDLLSGRVNLFIGDQEMQSFISPLQPDDRFRLQAERFFKCIEDDSAPYCSLNDGLKILGLINKVYANSCRDVINKGASI